MTAAGSARREELQQAIVRLQSRDARVTISAVAREAGVTAALVHNTYPDVAEQIRALQGKASGVKHDELRVEVARLRGENAKLRLDKAAAEADAKRLASMLETLRHELARARVMVASKVQTLLK